MAVTEELLSALVPAARVALPFVESMVEKGLSTTAIEATLKASGLSFRRTDFLELVRGVREVELSRDYLKSVPRKFAPNPLRLPAPVGKTLRAFSFKVNISGRGGITGAKASQTITVSSSTNMTREQAIAKAVDLFMADQQAYRPDSEPVEPSSIEAESGPATFQP